MRKKWPFDAGDMFVLASLGFIFYGAFMIEPAFAYLTIGAILFVLGILQIWVKAGQRGEDS